MDRERQEELAKLGGEVEADRRLTNCELVLARRFGKKMAADVMDEMHRAHGRK
jgi:hypothetical protein